MKFFSNLEKSLEGVIEKTLLGSFGGRAQPIEIARGLWREITANKRISVNKTYVPNFFLVTLSPGDHEYIKGIKKNIESEILEHLRSESKKRDFRFVGALTISWADDENIREGEFFVSSDFIEDNELPSKEDETPEPAGEQISGLPVSREKKVKNQETSDESSLVRGFFSVTGGFDSGKIFKLIADEYVIGRGDDCEIIIGDPKVSRRHARVYIEGKKYHIEDLGSRSGIYVNGEKVERAKLRNHCEVKMGMTVLKYTGK